MRIVFLGEDSFSAVVLESLLTHGHQVLSVYSPIYNNKISARLELVCNVGHVPFIKTDNINCLSVQNEIAKINPDLIVIAHFEKVLKKNIIDIPKYGCINLHPSLLPYYRGLSPQHWPIINGDEYTGITVHFVNEGIDTGDIIVQREVSISNDDYVIDLQMNMKRIYGQTVLEAIRKIEDGQFTAVKQRNNEGSYYGRLKEADCLIDVNGTVREAYNLIRGVSFPYIGASYKDFKIWRAKLSSVGLNGEREMSERKNGIYHDENFGSYIKFEDGILILEKFERYGK
jgi:methionyl-tRNA formyltransferase